MLQTTRDYRKLVVWGKAHRLTVDVYRMTAKFPRSQQYSLIDQMQRSAVSIPANIAEGCGRGGTVELARFMRIAQGSASELSYYLILASDLGFVAESSGSELGSRLDEVRRMLSAYLRTLKSTA